MTNKKKTFLNKFLLATSSIGLLASMEGFAANIVPVPNVHDLLDPNTAFTANINLWRSNNGNLRSPQIGDNIILSGSHDVEINNDIRLGDINNFGYRSNIVIAPNYVGNRVVIINNIINDDGVLYSNAGRDALGRPLVYGNKNAKIQLTLKECGIIGQGANNATLTITGNDIDAVDSIILGGGQSKIIFQNLIMVDAEIYARTNNAGYIVANNNIIFNKTIGFAGNQDHRINGLLISDNKTVTLKSHIYANDIELEKNSTLIIDASKQNILVNSGVATDVFGHMEDDCGKIELMGNTKNTITFYNDIGRENERVAEIKINRGKGVIFNNDVYAKKIIVGSNNVEFKEKLDMQSRDGNGDVINTGNLEFENYGKVKFNKDFTGNITTNKANIGEVTFVNTPNIYGVGALNKKIEKLIFTGSHMHNLRKNIRASSIEFDAGTYNVHANPVIIDGNAKINGSTFDLRHNVIFTGNVEFSNNIFINTIGRINNRISSRQVQQNQQQVQQQAQAQREANERAAVEENNRRIEEQRLQAEYQQHQANEIRVAEEYVKKSETQKLAEAINNTIVVHTENTFVAEAQKEVIREKSALVMKNPEKHAVELAKELVNNKVELKEAVKVASDDTAIKAKTKQEHLYYS